MNNKVELDDMPQETKKDNTQPSMKWHKWMVNFSLWLGAVVSAAYGVISLTGVQYEGMAEQVYAMFDGLQMVDMLYGVLLIGMAAFTICVRFRLAHFRKSGIKGLLAMFVLNAVIAAVYYAVASGIIGDMSDVASEVGSSLAGAAVSFIIHRTYYNKRMHLFSDD